MPYVNPDIADAGLTHYAGRVTAVYLCEAYPTTYTEAVDTHALAYKSGPTLVGPDDREGGGRIMRLIAFTDGVAVRSGVPLYYAVVDAGTSERLTVAEIEEAVEVVGDQPVAITRDIILSQPLYEDAP